VPLLVFSDHHHRMNSCFLMRLNDIHLVLLFQKDSHTLPSLLNELDIRFSHVGQAQSVPRG